MRNLGIGIVLAALVGCAPAREGPEQFAAPVTAPPDEVRACVTEQLERLGYQVTEQEPDAAQVGTRLNEPAWPLQLLGYRTTADRIAVTIGANELRVTALAAEDVPEPGTVGTPIVPVGQQEAEQVLAACAE
jgi:hypothetical protein